MWCILARGVRSKSRKKEGGGKIGPTCNDWSDSRVSCSACDLQLLSVEGLQRIVPLERHNA